jgi:outer membrane protein assembly factor BamB
MPPQERKRRWWRIVLILGIAMVALVGAAAAYVVTQEEDDVTNPDVEFRAEPSATPAPEDVEPDAPGKAKTDPVDRFVWAHYGYTRDRRRYLPLKRPLRPPYKEIWQYQGNVLLEFPPVIGGTRLFLLDDNGVLRGIDKHSGRTLWRKRLGALAAASPAYGDGKVYVVLLQRKRKGPKSRTGRVAALDAKTGKLRWSRELSSRSESSPLLDGGTLYFGSESGTVYAMDAADGDVRWRFKASGAVKGGLALADGRLFFGAYGNSLYALRQRDGSQIWRASTDSGAFGLGGGNFYSTPAVAYGRVYIGSTNGRMYSFGADSGKIAWSRDTGGYVYASPAVAQVPDAPALVYAGSYDGRFYAWDAQTGDVRWSRGGYGRISGGATVIGDIVYFADLGNKKTYGLGARTGGEVFEFERGSYNPVVSDGQTIDLAGYHAMYALQPLTAQARRARRKAEEVRAERRARELRTCRKRARAAHAGRPRSIRNSVERCVARKRAARLRVPRAKCFKRAKEAHGKREGRVRRSFKACVKDRGLRARG